MPDSKLSMFAPSSLARDLPAALVVFFVALPLCLGVALASNAPLISGLIAGIVGGVLVGILSGSHTSVSGPAAGLTAVVAAEIAILGSFETFLSAVVIAGAIQIAMGAARLGFLSAFIPSAVLKGLLVAIGLILILKQLPHLFGHDTDPEGEMAFQQPDHENTFSEIIATLSDLHPGAATIGLGSIALLLLWDRFRTTKNSSVPAPLVVVVFGVILGEIYRRVGGAWFIGQDHLVQVPAARTFAEFVGFLHVPDFSRWNDPAVLTAGFTIAFVASLETMINIEAVDKIDPRQRNSPASRELIAQGIGNMACGFAGGLPITSYILRGSVNINAGNRTKLSAIFHGILILSCVLMIPNVLNRIPLACLAAILFVTGVKLVGLRLFREMWEAGRYQFLPFAATVLAIVFTNLLTGVVIGLLISLAFIVYGTLRRPARSFIEHHLGGDVQHVVLSNQVTFLNRAALTSVLDAVPRGGHLLLDGQNTEYIDPDILSLLRDFHEQAAPARRIKVSYLGFRKKYLFSDRIEYVDYSTRDLQANLTPAQVLQILREGNERFRTGRRLTRDFARQVSATSESQFPLAVMLSCTDSRSPGELIFDLGVGDIFSVRVAGNVNSREVLGSMEYGCVAAGAKLVLVMGHTRCGAVTAAVRLADKPESIHTATGCRHVEHILSEVQPSIDRAKLRDLEKLSAEEQAAFIDSVARSNVINVVRSLTQRSDTLAKLLQEGRIAIAGAMYDISTGTVEFLETSASE